MTKENYSMIGRFALVLTAFLSGTLAEPRTSAAGPTPVLTAGSDTVHVGDVFAIPISIANTAGLTSFRFDLAFDPTIITALSFTDSGTDFDLAASSGGGFLTGITGFIDNTTGLLSGIADSISGLITGTGLTPGGVLVDIDFQALALGISPLALSNAFLTDNGVPLSSANGDFSLQNGQVTVVAPEPGSLILLGSALGGLAMLRRCRSNWAENASESPNGASGAVPASKILSEPGTRTGRRADGESRS